MAGSPNVFRFKVSKNILPLPATPLPYPGHPTLQKCLQNKARGDAWARAFLGHRWLGSESGATGAAWYSSLALVLGLHGASLQLCPLSVRWEPPVPVATFNGEVSLPDLLPQAPTALTSFSCEHLCWSVVTCAGLRLWPQSLGQGDLFSSPGGPHPQRHPFLCGF